MTHVKLNNRVLSNTVIDELFNNFPAFLNNNFGESNLNVPPTNIYETKDAFHLELNVPGRSKEDFKVNIDKGILTISFEKPEEKQIEGQKTIRREFSYAGFKRSFNVDEKIDINNINGKYENGLLKLTLPKTEQHKVEARQIAIQ